MSYTECGGTKMNATTSPTSVDIRPAVAAALEANRPVVAMVSSPLTHTLSWPTNMDVVRTAEEAVRQEGGVLAVTAIWKGRLTVGLEARETELLIRDNTVHRAGRRDLASAIVGGWNAGTTVSATMYIASKTGIRLVATAAVGTARPSRNNQPRVWDISSDLMELSQTPVAVISAGARSVSHLSYAAEVLDTFRVPIVGYRTDTFPTFYMNIGTSPVSSRVNTPAEAAEFLKVHWSIDGAGVVIAQPTTADMAISPDELLPALRSIEEQADKEGVVRKDLSLFLMDKLNRLTRGKALRAYHAVLVANARLAAQIARDLSAAKTKD
jgi:pseudouridine-5'-phosphate glycosidase